MISHLLWKVAAITNNIKLWILIRESIKAQYQFISRCKTIIRTLPITTNKTDTCEKTEGKETHNIWLLGEAKQYGLVGIDTGRNQEWSLLSDEDICILFWCVIYFIIGFCRLQQDAKFGCIFCATTPPLWEGFLCVSFVDWNTGSSTALPMYPLSRIPSLGPIEFDPAVLFWTCLVLTAVPCPGCTTGPDPELQELPVWPRTCPTSTGFCTVVWPLETRLLKYYF